MSTRYRQIANELISRIRRGDLAVGERLPGELELMQRFDVSRHTVRSALQVVESEGLIERRAGVGTRVQARRPRRPGARAASKAYVQQVTSPAALMQYPRQSRLVVQASGELRADRRLAALLECTPGTRWTKISALRRVAGTARALAWTDIYLLPEYAGVASNVGRQGGLVAQLVEQQFGEHVESVRVDLRGDVLGGEIAAALKVKEGTPALTTIRRYTGRGGKVFEVTVSRHPADRYSYSMQLERDWR